MSMTLGVVVASMVACSEVSGPDQTAPKNQGPASLALLPGTPGLVAAYGFDEAVGSSAVDASGNNNSGTLSSGVTRTASGKFGGALVFSGNYVSVPNAASLDLTTQMTLEAWVYPTSAPSGWATVIMKEQPGDYVYSLYNASPSYPSIEFNISTDPSGERITTATSPAPVNTWTHLAGTFDGTTARLYVNGTQVASKAYSGPIATSGNPLRIGGNTVWGEFFRGRIDEVRVYNRALSAGEIQTDMTTPVSSAPSADVTAPTVAVTSPTSGATYTTTANTVTLSGAASDNVGVTQVTWANDRGGSGSATGTTNWSAANIALQAGVNVLTITARDAANNSTSATVAVTVSGSTTSGLVAAYGFNEASGTTIADASGSNNAGSFGSGVTRAAAGRFGGALAFNGSFVSVPAAASLALTSGMTVEAWVNPSSVGSAWSDVLMKGNDNYYLMASTNNNAVPAGAGLFGGEAKTTKAWGSSPLAANAWTHLALTYDGASLRLYVNGALSAGVARTGTLATSSAPLTIGGDPTYGQFFRGMIDEVRVYNRALSATEVQADMNTPVGGAAQPTDPTPPSVAIAAPQASGTYTTTAPQVALSGVANDNVGVTQVRWTNSRGGAGTCSGTTNWSATAVPLQAGTNVITVTAQDAANNVANTVLTVVNNTTSPTATQVTITVQPSASAQAGVAFAQQPVVQLRDASNNAVSQSGVVVTASIATGGGTLGGTTTATTNASGVASFTNLSITGANGARTLQFAAPSLTAATSSAITVSNPTPTATKLTITTQPSSSAQAGTAFAQQPVIQLRDAANAAVGQSGVVVTATIVAGGGTLGGTTTATTNASGVASFTNLSITGSDGSRTLQFAAASLTSVTSNAIAVTNLLALPPAATAMYFNSSEPGCGSDPSIVLCDDFENGSWYGMNCDLANASGGLLQTKGWCGTIFSSPTAGAAVCSGAGAAGTNCAASGGLHNGSTGGVNMADHNLGPNANGYNEIWLRYYIKPSLGYQYGAQKMITFNSTPAGNGGISVGGSGSPFGDGAFDTCPVYDCNTTGEIYYYRQNQGSKLTLSQMTGHWAYVEMHVKLNTPGQANGIWELWLNDCGTDGKCTGTPTLRSRYTTVKWQGPSDNKQIRSIWFENWANPGSVGTELYDQLVVKTSGPIGFVP